MYTNHNPISEGPEMYTNHNPISEGPEMYINHILNPIRPLHCKLFKR